MPEGAIYVGRPSRWGNPFVRGRKGPWPPETAVANFRGWFATMTFIDTEQTRAVLRELLAPLRGHDLACWCPLDQPCHADVLLELANA
jgi:hypothetical protein